METARTDVWTWAVRIYGSRSLATAACRAGHVKVNGKSAKPAQPIRVGDKVEAQVATRQRVVVVTKVIGKRVGAPLAAECYEDHTPPPPPKEETPFVPRRDRGAGRPTKRDRRAIERLRGRF